VVYSMSSGLMGKGRKVASHMAVKSMATRHKQPSSKQRQPSRHIKNQAK
jgi:hypothetical protein